MKKVVIIILTLLIMITLAACDGGEDGSTDTETTVSTEGETTAEVPSDGSAVDVFAKEASFTVIRPEEWDAELISAFTTWLKDIEGRLGYRPPVSTDWSRDNRDNHEIVTDDGVHEVLLGVTNRKESRDMATGTTLDCGYTIKYVNGKLVVYGTDINSMLSAMEEILNMCDTGTGKLTLTSDFEKTYSFTGDGSIISELMTKYRIVISANAYDREVAGARVIKESLEKMSGKTISITKDSKKDTDNACEILVGNTNRSESSAISSELAYTDYKIKINGNKIVIVGGSPLATENAAKKFAELVTGLQLTVLEDNYEYCWLLKEKRPDSIIWNMDAFVPAWQGKITIPEWMTDWNEKMYASLTPYGRLSSDAHRGDTQNYPENSAEGILSAVLLGADSVEIDIRMTKDGVMVLSHDDNLKRTTNWDKKAGRNGLPSSAKVCDWTYEQLLQLNLRSGTGGTKSVLTDYKICTAYEAVAIMAGRTMIHWDCKESDEIQRDTDTFLLAADLGAKANFFHYYTDAVMQTWMNLDRSDKEFADFIKQMTAIKNEVGGSRRKRYFQYIEQFGDDPAAWVKHGEHGCMNVFTNKIMDFAIYTAEVAEPLNKISK